MPVTCSPMHYHCATAAPLISPYKTTEYLQHDAKLKTAVTSFPLSLHHSALYVETTASLSRTNHNAAILLSLIMAAAGFSDDLINFRKTLCGTM